MTGRANQNEALLYIVKCIIYKKSAPGNRMAGVHSARNSNHTEQRFTLHTGRCILRKRLQISGG